MMIEKMKPFVKYPGGKTKEIPIVLERLPKDFKRYVEPFVGGGSIYFALDFHPSYINDKSIDLYNLYVYIKEQINDFKETLFLIDSAWKTLI